MTQNHLKRTLRGVLLAACAGAALPAAAEPAGDDADVLDAVNLEGGWIVVNDQAVWFGPDLRVLLPSGVSAVGAQALKPGAAVVLAREFRDGRPYVSVIQVLDRPPARRDAGGTGGDR